LAIVHAVAVADLHGNARLYELLLRIVDAWRISSVFIAGDLLPGGEFSSPSEAGESTDLVEVQRRFIERTLAPLLQSFLAAHRHTDVYAIMGNDDCRANEALLRQLDEATPGFHLLNDGLVELRDARQMHTFFADEIPLLSVTGYPYVPPGAGLLVDWVKYENCVHLRPPGMDPCVDIYDLGIQTVPTQTRTTIADDLADYGRYLQRSSKNGALSYEADRTIHLFHSPPYNTPLDWMPPQGRHDHLRLPDHVGSSEIGRFIERTQPYLVLCGHCHEAVVLGGYRTQMGCTWCVNPGSQAHIDVLSVVQFNVYDPSEMKQLFISAR
jgi:Icc-related predicted phosphoesterase